jgi:hypothetical protein
MIDNKANTLFDQCQASSQMNMSEDHGDICVVAVSQLNRLFTPMKNTLHQGLGRSWALGCASNLSGVERNNEP